MLEVDTSYFSGQMVDIQSFGPNSIVRTRRAVSAMQIIHQSLTGNRRIIDVE